QFKDKQSGGFWDAAPFPPPAGDTPKGENEILFRASGNKPRAGSGENGNSAMGIFDALKGQLRSVIEWERPGPDELFRQWSADGDEIKNASKLIISPGQGCIFVYEGRIRAVARHEGMV